MMYLFVLSKSFLKRFALLFSIPLSLFIPFSSLQAQTSSTDFTLTYQGDLKDAAFQPLEGEHRLTFRLYTSLNSSTFMWEEHHNTVVFHQGHFTVDLGSLTPFPLEEMKDDSLFLGLSIDNDE